MVDQAKKNIIKARPAAFDPKVPLMLPHIYTILDDVVRCMVLSLCAVEPTLL